MNLYAKLQARAAQNKPIRIGVIGAGKFASMYLAQVPKTPGIHLVGIADLLPDNAKRNLARVGWPSEHTAPPHSMRRWLMATPTSVTTGWPWLNTRPLMSWSKPRARPLPRSTIA